MQVQYIESINEIEKTRNLLRVQININNEQKKEISILQKRLGSTKQDFQDQLTGKYSLLIGKCITILISDWLSEYQKLLEMRANKIQKLETQLRESAFGSVQKNFNSSHVETGQVRIMVQSKIISHIVSGSWSGSHSSHRQWSIIV